MVISMMKTKLAHNNDDDDDDDDDDDQGGDSIIKLPLYCRQLRGKWKWT